ncbi:hypothetical protein D3C80_1652950 [compost metagenome]
MKINIEVYCITDCSNFTITGICLFLIEPSIWNIWQHLSLEILINVLPQRHILVIPQIRVGFRFTFAFTHFGGVVLLS